jgi:hypothetical protein
MDDRPSKSRWLAFLLSFVLPGAGLAYLGNWRLGAVNLVVAILFPLFVATTMSDVIVEHIHYVFLVIAVGSGAFAHAKASEYAQ